MRHKVKAAEQSDVTHLKLNNYIRLKEFYSFRKKFNLLTEVVWTIYFVNQKLNKTILVITTSFMDRHPLNICSNVVSNDPKLASLLQSG